MTRTCTGPCGQAFPATVEYFYKNRKGRLGLGSYCKTCHKALAGRNLNREKRRQRNRKYELKKLYGMDPQVYQEKKAGQDGGCAICGTTEEQAGRALAVDHDHATAQIRGLLCFRCNVGLSHFREDPELLRSAIGYLKLWSVHELRTA